MPPLSPAILLGGFCNLQSCSRLLLPEKTLEGIFRQLRDVALLVIDNTAQVIMKTLVYIDTIVLGELFQFFI